MLEFLAGSGMFMPHGHCYLWTPALLWMMVGSDVLIALSYFAIPLMLAYFVRRRPDVPFRRVLILFSVFIVMCGLTHAWDIVTTWWPSYWVEASLKLVTGVVSCATAVVLWPTLPQALALRSPAELEAANRKLEEAVAELEAANAELRASERLKTRLVENLSDDLRTPLTLVQSPAEALLSGVHGPVPERWKVLLRSIANNSARLDELVQNALELARLDAGQLEVVRQPVDVGGLLRQVVRDFDEPAAGAGLTLTLDDRLTDGVRELDRYLFERVLLNLLTNALKFTPVGGRVDVRLLGDEAALVVEVADTGPGIDPDQIDHLFGRFSQGDSSRTRRHGGAGLGLALVREVVDLLDGVVQVESTPGEGALFRVTLPAPPTTLPATPLPGADNLPVLVHDAADESPEPRPAPLPRLLLAEDNSEMAGLIAAVLQDVADVRHVPDGAAAWRALVDDRPDMLLADVMMPELDGLALCRRVKADPDLRDLPVVLLSARGGREALMEGWSAGADEYLFKPFHPRELQARVTSILEAAQARQSAVAARARADQAEAHNSELAAVAASLSHDVAAPLRIIHQSLGLLGTMDDPASDAAILEAVRERVARLQDLTGALLGWLRAGRIGPDRTGTALAAGMEEARALVSLPEGFVLELDGAEVVVPLHRADLVAVISNLIRNSVQHHDRTEGTIRLSGDRPEGGVRLTVEDDGPGIPDDQKGPAVELFRSGPTGGTGVGLALVDRIARRTGGTVSISDRPEGGARIAVTWKTASEGRSAVEDV